LGLTALALASLAKGLPGANAVSPENTAPRLRRDSIRARARQRKCGQPVENVGECATRGKQARGASMDLPSSRACRICWMDGRPELARAAAEHEAAAGAMALRERREAETLAAETRPAETPGTNVLAVGDRVAHFVIRGRIGQGGMGVIYRAEDEQLQREVALKVLPPAFASDADRRRRLLREARAAASVSHPHIAAVHEVGEADGRIFVAMELVAGKSLAQRIDEEALDVDEVASIATQILDGLACAHAAGIVHRDLKPANVMITPRSTVKVLDFGLAVRRSDPQLGVAMESTLTADGQLVGTPAYMAPEQVRGLAVDERTDLFSFGALVYEMLTGRLPFEGRTVADTLSAILRDDPPPLATVRPDAPAALVRIVERCLAKDPAARFASCEEVSAALRQAVSGLERTTKVHLTSSADVVAAPPPPKRSKRWIAALAGAIAIGAGAIAAAGTFRAPPPPAPQAPATAQIQAAAPTAVAITERPAPRSDKPEALVEYAAALRACRDANWKRAEEHLKKAIEIDPTLTAATLRLLVIRTHYDGFHKTDGETYFARAVEGRAALDEHDQALLSALSFYYTGDRLDTAGVIAKWREIAAKFPEDAELASVGAYYLVKLDPALALAEAERATRLDPSYADAWQLEARALSKLGRVDEADAALDRCTSLSPIADDCWVERAMIAADQGRCDVMEKDLRRLMSRSQVGFEYIPRMRAEALHALGQPEEAVLEVFRAAWELADPKERRLAELGDRAALDLAHGRFADAERRLREEESAAPANDPASNHANRMSTLSAALHEMGRDDEAVRVVEGFRLRKNGWTGAVPAYLDMGMLRFLLHTGRLSQAAFADERTGVLARMGGEATPWARWIMGDVVGIELPAEAEQALAARGGLEPPGQETQRSAEKWGAPLSRTLLLAGKPAEAAPGLSAAASTCWELAGPITFIRTRFDLGRALDQSGDKDGACKAYASVVARWGKATPRSVTSDQAKARMTALGCP
jgi:serine/threonine-protein kinase